MAKRQFEIQDGIIFPDGSTQTTAYLGPGGYKGFGAIYGKMFNNNDDPNGPINKIVIYQSTVIPTSTIDESTSNDTFEVTGLAGSSVVGIVVAVSTNITETATADLETFAQSIIDNVILNNGTEGDVNDIATMKIAFYDNFNNFKNIIPSIKTNLEFFNESNRLFSINWNNAIYTGAGSGFYLYSVRLNPTTLQITMDSGSNGVPGGYVVGETITILGTDVTDYNGANLASPLNDLTITVDTVDGSGVIQTYTITGTLPDYGVSWPSNNIGDGGDDEYDTANYISTNLGSNISYNDGNAQYGSSEFGNGDYVTVYKDGIFGMFAVNAAINSIKTDGNSGFDGDGQATTGTLISSGPPTVNLGDYTFNASQMTTPSPQSGDFPNGVITLAPGATNNTNFAASGQFINIYPTGAYDAPHIHIDAGNGYQSKGDLILGTDSYHVDVNHTGTIYIKTNNQNNAWIFDNNGHTKIPGNLNQNNLVTTYNPVANTVGGGVAGTIWNTNYGVQAVKFLVNGIESTTGKSQSCEVLVTKDSSNVLATTVYALVHTSTTPLFTLNAAYDSGNGYTSLDATVLGANAMTFVVSATVIFYD